MSEQTNQELVVSPEVAKNKATAFFDPYVWAQMKGMAETFVASKALPTTENAATVVMKIQAGYEMGMKPIESLKSFYFVNGNLTIFGAAVTRRLREHGWRILYIDEENKCTAKVRKYHTKDDFEEYEDSLTFEEAEKSKWTKTAAGQLKAGWYEGANRKLKLRYGVISMILKTYIPEVLGSAVDITEVVEDLDMTTVNQVQIPESAGDSQPATEAQLQTVKQLAEKAGIEVDTQDMTQKQAKEFMAEQVEVKKGRK